MNTVNNFRKARSLADIPVSIEGYQRVVVAGLDVNQAKAKAQEIRSPASWFWKNKLYAFVALKKAER
jgi:hypothetical protein